MDQLIGLSISPFMNVAMGFVISFDLYTLNYSKKLCMNDIWRLQMSQNQIKTKIRTFSRVGLTPRVTHLANIFFCKKSYEFKARLHCFLMQVVMNKCFLLNPEKKFSADPSCCLRENAPLNPKNDVVSGSHGSSGSLKLTLPC